MVELLEQLNIHSSRDIIARHGLTLPELFEHSLEFYKEEKHQFNLTYDQKNQLAAYWKQSTLGPYHPDKLNPGYFDFVGNDRKKAWEALGEISVNGAMAGFCNLLETVCPDLVPWIRHKKRGRENKIKEDKLNKEKIRKEKEAEEMEASKLINIVKKAELAEKLSNKEESSDEDEDMPTLERNSRDVTVSQTTPNGHIIENGEAEQIIVENGQKVVENEQSSVEKEQSITQNGLSNEIEPETVLQSTGEPVNGEVLEQTGEVLEQNGEVLEQTVESTSPQTDDQSTSPPEQQSNNNEQTTEQVSEQSAATPEALNAILTQHFACVMYLNQMKDAGHTLTAEQETYIQQMSVYEDQMRALRSRLVQVSDGKTVEEPMEEHKEEQQTELEQDLSQESFAVVEAQSSIAVIKSDDVITSNDDVIKSGDVHPIGEGLTESAEDVLLKEVQNVEHSVSDVAEPETEKTEKTEVVDTEITEKTEVVDTEITENPDIPQNSSTPIKDESTAPANALEVAALAETLQKQLPDHEVVDDGDVSDVESESDVRMWSKTGVDLFIGEVSRDTDSVLNVGRGETVTVRIPTYESGTALYWEFATQHYDIGFGASFEWEEEEEAVTSSGRQNVTKIRREPILPILRRSSHEKVITGSHAFPRSGTYLLMFDNSYSLLRSKTVYYRVFYTR